MRHDDGTLTKYFHLDAFSVRNGQRVEAGQQIGTMGRTGNTPAQGDTHLHFEMWRDGRQVDPLPHLQGAERDAAVPARTATPEVLRDGSSGAAVRELQQRLNELGYRGVDGRPLETVSGKFGPQTEHALRDFQTDRALKVDGVFGARTRDALSASATEPSAAAARRDNGREEGGQREFVDKLFSAMRDGDATAMQRAMDDYLKTAAGQEWKKESTTAEQQVVLSDQAGPAR